MRPLLHKLTPSKGFSHAVYVAFNVLLPVLLFLLVRADLFVPAIVVLLLSKWRMFAVRPRFWWANVRANAVDILVGLSAIAAMYKAESEWVALLYAAAWAGWLLLLKPRTSTLWVSLQAFIGMAVSLVSIFIIFKSAPLWLLVVAFGAICFFASNHFFYSFDEQYIRLLAYVWAYFGAALMWVLGHWLIFYGFISQPALILITLGFGLGTLYYLDHFDKLSVGVRRQVLFILTTTMLIIIIFSDWGDKIV